MFATENRIVLFLILEQPGKQVSFTEAWLTVYFLEHLLLPEKLDPSTFVGYLTKC